MENRLIKAVDAILGRAFVIGPAVVDPSEQWHGHDTETFGPTEYGDYIATSTYVNVCATLRARLLSGLPIRVYKGLQTDREEVESGKLYELLQKVNPYWTMGRLMSMTELSLSLWGSCFWFVERAGGSSGRGEPREIWWGRPDRVRVIPHPDKYVSGFIYTSSNGGQEIAYAPHQVIWIRYPNPIDEYSGLSPLAAARLSADTASSAMRSNRNIFTNGSNMGGIVTPVGDNGRQGTFDAGTALELTDILGKKLKGVDNAHRVAVLRFDAKFQPVTMSPKDAEFLGLMKLTLEDIARAYGVPLDLIGGQRTYENYESAQRAIWTQTIVPETKFIASELTEQLLPMFNGQADMIEFDLSDIDVLKESEDSAWSRWEGQIRVGVHTINEWREEQGLDAVPWGDVAWMPTNLLPVGDGAEDVLPVSTQIDVLDKLEPEIDSGLEDDDDDIVEGEYEVQVAGGRVRRTIEYGGADHERIWTGQVRRIENYERKVQRAVIDLFRRQQQAYTVKIRKGLTPSVSAGRAVDTDFFDKARWTKRYRAEMKPIFRALILAAIEGSMDDLLFSIDFDVTDPNFIRFLEERSQRFAEQVNSRTWALLQESLGQGITAGETMDQLADRVQSVMGKRIRSSSQTIARTETIGAMNGGTLLSWEQSGQVETKQWVAALDERTRDSHVKAHGQTVPMDKPFKIGKGHGMAPGQINRADETINCRCVMVPGLRILAALPQSA